MANLSMTATAMTEALGRFLDVDVARYKLISVNLANIDTPGYHTQDLDFRAELERSAAEDSGQPSGQLASASLAPIGHHVRGLIERPDGNNVSVERETLLLAEAQMKFSLGVQLLKDQFHLISTAINSGGTSS
jgi:flagellar basal-body rod protein FlgB